MAILAIIRTDGDPTGLLQIYDETIGPATADMPARPDLHICAPTDSGVVIVDVWPSLDDLRRNVVDNEKFESIWRDAGWPSERVEVYEIHSQGWPSP